MRFILFKLFFTYAAAYNDIITFFKIGAAAGGVWGGDGAVVEGRGG